MRLETRDELSDAIGTYQMCGYREVAPFSGEFYADHWFEKSPS